MMEFFAMGGHGFFIWSSYGVALLVMVIEAFLVWCRHKKACVDLKRLEQQMSLGGEG